MSTPHSINNMTEDEVISYAGSLTSSTAYQENGTLQLIKCLIEIANHRDDKDDEYEEISLISKTKKEIEMIIQDLEMSNERCNKGVERLKILLQDLRNGN